MYQTMLSQVNLTFAFEFGFLWINVIGLGLLAIYVVGHLLVAGFHYLTGFKHLDPNIVEEGLFGMLDFTFFAIYTIFGISVTWLLWLAFFMIVVACWCLMSSLRYVVRLITKET